MAFDPASVLAPDGKLELSWFGGLSDVEVVARLTGYADDIAATVTTIGDGDTEDKATEAWVYASGYEHIASALARKLGTIVVEPEVRKTTAKEGPAFFQSKADDWFAVFYGLVPWAKPAPRRKSGSVSLAARFRV